MADRVQDGVAPLTPLRPGTASDSVIAPMKENEVP